MTEWLDEPDKDEFEHAGLKCLILRHSELGHLCGYVAVPKGHLCYGKDYDHIPYDDLFPVEVHGGLTWCKEGDGDLWPEGYWWFGFDCAHAWDLVPQILELEKCFPDLKPLMSSNTYRNFQYVRRETEDLAKQVVTLEFIDWEFKWVWPLLLPPRTQRGIWNKKGEKYAENRGNVCVHR
ncbi:hypothetical protein ES703_27524 [subsurface metagenome]